MEPPVTISNTVVKRTSANDSCRATDRENRSLPGHPSFKKITSLILQTGASLPRRCEALLRGPFLVEFFLSNLKNYFCFLIPTQASAPL